MGASRHANVLRDCVVVQLGTATLAAAGEIALDGAIMCYPDSIGPDNEAPVMVGGGLTGLDAAKPILRQITSNVVELGSNISAAATLDLGHLTMSV